MEIFAGGSFVDFVNNALMNSDRSGEDYISIEGEERRPSHNILAKIRHTTLQLSLIFLCGIAQLSPAAYFLRRDLFSSIASFIKSPDTEQYTFEAVLLLAILADFHKSDAAKLNPYLSRIKDSDDKDLMRKICWAANFALTTSIKQYQEISDDDMSPTLAATFNTFISSLRPDRALSSTPVDPPRELFKSQPIEATVILLPLYEFLRGNMLFSSIFLESLSDEDSQYHPPLTIISLSSYLLTHATSASQPRSIAYAGLGLNVLLALVENDAALTVFSRPCKQYIRLCRQRLPLLPAPARTGRVPICALLDCCVLWLQHNLHIRLEVQLYMKCIWICHRIVFYLQKTRNRLEYSWKEFWSALLGLLHFLATKIDSLLTTGGVEQLIRETVLLLNLCLSKCEYFLPAPRSIHELIYELVRSSSDLQSQAVLMKKLAMPEATNKRHSLNQQQPTEVLMRLITTTQFYERKITEVKARTPGEAFRAIARDIDANGLHGVADTREPEPLVHSDAVFGFSRYACLDGLALMP
ncbi:hypothetical protein BDZ89DRAFT_1207601 [Hymenopellis radicata]|nr:hypothetical protein BDZ89DRAFT_1207601 [Hymenopellis radicata]